ncbi:BET1 homolog [Sycon ciliatum]|uniref:BET1 homolog n=1 Tax=Sycon ciliatum TaxID=27933 RepID=UPI0020AC76B7|eukprot:scpid102014/ scgid31541/ BET1 homolog; Golgi vesicular membrane-trafficking protein p18
MQSRGRSHGTTRTEEMFANENDRIVESMTAKVAQLKSVSLDIGREVREQNAELLGMGSEFDNAGGLLGSTMKRLGLMSKAGHNNWMCYMIAFVLFVFFVTYFLVR